MLRRRLAAIAMASLPLWGCALETNIIEDAISAGAPRNEDVDDLTVVTPSPSEVESPVPRAPEAAPITVRVAHPSGDQAATINIQFFIHQPVPTARVRQVAPPDEPGRLVRTTTFQMRPGSMPVDIGPELASRVEVRGTFEDGISLHRETYIFPIEFEAPDGSLLTYTIEDTREGQGDTADPAELVDDQVPNDEIVTGDGQDPVDEIVVEDEPEDADENDVPPIDTGGGTGGGGTIVDCNDNNVEDATDIAAGTSQDCNGNGQPDECEIAEGFVEDCNLNGAPDDCDLADGSSRDFNEDGIPDECGLLVITPIESVATFGQTIRFTATQDVTWETSVSPDGDADNNPGTIAADGTYSPPPSVDLTAAPVVRIRATSIGTPGLFAIAQVSLSGSTTAAPRIESLLSGPGSPGENPMNVTTSLPVTTLLVPGLGNVDGLGLNVTSAQPPTRLLLSGRGDVDELNLNVTTADPPIAVLIPGTDDTDGLSLNTFVSQPPVTSLLPSAGDGGELPLNVTVADPTIMILLPGQGSAVLSLNVFVAEPPLVILLSGPDFLVLPLNVFVADPPVGGKGGPGGFDGGTPGFGAGVPSGAGLGPGAGLGGGGAGGYGSSLGGALNGPAYGSPLLLPMVGGSGGGGTDGQPGAGGHGGGGGLLLASNTVVQISGTVESLGATATSGIASRFGSGGGIRIIAPVVRGSGRVDVRASNFASTADGRIRIDAIDRSQLTLVFDPLSQTSVGTFMAVFNDVTPRLDITEVAGQEIAVGTAAPVFITLPFGSDPNRQVTVQGTDFTGIVPISVVLTPESGSPIVVDTELDMSGGNPSSVTVDVTLPINTLIHVNAWTR